jgi:hypothetical protein
MGDLLQHRHEEKAADEVEQGLCLAVAEAFVSIFTIFARLVSRGFLRGLRHERSAQWRSGNKAATRGSTGQPTSDRKPGVSVSWPLNS